MSLFILLMGDDDDLYKIEKKNESNMSISRLQPSDFSVCLPRTFFNIIYYKR